ncbi:MAG: DUF362 domain-containing protein [Desulfovibrio sp.]|nr:MAG: DUF362 domain-containing protein [Desulfovibrio sp.]
MPSTVYFANLRARTVQDNKTNKVLRLFDAADLGNVLGENDLTAIKLHFGQPGSDCFIRPVFVRAVVDRIREHQAEPFLTDTNTLYAGGRHNGVLHYQVAMAHGFAYAVVNAPVIIADGLRDESVASVDVNLKRFKQVKIAGAIDRADSMIVMSHFKGHELAGFGGAIKNLAMGCAPPIGKREQHNVRFIVNEETCIACGECEAICPEGAATVEDKASISNDLCIGCGECYIHCPEKAVQLDWRTDVPEFMERMTEYAYGAVKNKLGKVGYINFLMDVTPDCDCLGWSDAPIVRDIGILASTDPVALDQASLDLVNQQAGLDGTHLGCNLGCGEDKFSGLWSHTRGSIQLSYGEEIGLGSREYTLEEI